MVVLQGEPPQEEEQPLSPVHIQLQLNLAPTIRRPSRVFGFVKLQVFLAVLESPGARAVRARPPVVGKGLGRHLATPLREDSPGGSKPEFSSLPSWPLSIVLPIACIGATYLILSIQSDSDRYRQRIHPPDHCSLQRLKSWAGSPTPCGRSWGVSPHFERTCVDTRKDHPGSRSGKEVGGTVACAVVPHVRVCIRVDTLLAW